MSYAYFIRIKIKKHKTGAEFVEGLRKALEILNKNEQSILITDTNRIEIKEYLDLLDITVDIPTEFIPVKDDRIYRTVIT